MDSTHRIGFALTVALGSLLLALPLAFGQHERGQVPPGEPPGSETTGEEPPAGDAVTCAAYCKAVIAACTAATGQPLYPDEAGCLSACELAAWPAGASGAKEGDSLSCRITWARAGASDPTACRQAGPISASCRGAVASAPASGHGVPGLEPGGKCVLGLYDATDPKKEAYHAQAVILDERVQRVASAAGYTLTTFDISTGLPPNAMVAGCPVIVTAFSDSSMLGAVAYIDWLAANIDAGRKVVILNDFGAYKEATAKDFLEPEVVNRPLTLLGVRYDAMWTNKAKLLSVASKDPAMFHKVPNPKAAKHYYRFAVVRDDVQVHLSVTRSDLNAGDSAVVFTSPRGGMAFTRYYETQRGDEQLDLGAFMGKVLPAP